MSLLQTLNYSNSQSIVRIDSWLVQMLETVLKFSSSAITLLLSPSPISYVKLCSFVFNATGFLNCFDSQSIVRFDSRMDHVVLGVVSRSAFVLPKKPQLCCYELLPSLLNPVAITLLLSPSPISYVKLCSFVFNATGFYNYFDSQSIVRFDSRMDHVVLGVVSRSAFVLPKKPQLCCYELLPSLLNPVAITLLLSPSPISYVKLCSFVFNATGFYNYFDSQSIVRFDSRMDHVVLGVVSRKLQFCCYQLLLQPFLNFSSSCTLISSHPLFQVILPSLLLSLSVYRTSTIEKPCRHPSPKDLTADGDIESNPGPWSKDSLEYLNPGQWIDDYAFSEYSKHLFKEANLDWECYFITPGEMWSDFFTDGYCQNKIDDARERSTRYFAVPLNDAMNTTGGSGGVHWGLMVIDCAENNAIFVDPIVGSSYLSSVVDELCRKVTLNVQRVNITKTQTPNHCGIYVIGYIQKFVELISRDRINLSLISIERALIQVNNELNAADLRKQIQKLFTYVDDQLFIKYSKILVESTGLIFYDYVIRPTDLYPLLYGDQPYDKYPLSDFLTQKFFQCGEKKHQQMLLVPVNSAMCDLNADGRHWGLIILIISSHTSHILFIDPTYDEDDYAREFPANQTPVAPTSSNLFSIVSQIYSVSSVLEIRDIRFIPSNIKHTLTDSGFCVLEYIELLMNVDQSVVIRWTDVKELLCCTTIDVHESRSKNFGTF
ncbi:hypothetical protein GEMRC1_004844 [Eukaryota sp. GEM-RC1]